MKMMNIVLKVYYKLKVSNITGIFSILGFLFHCTAVNCIIRPLEMEILQSLPDKFNSSLSRHYTTHKH